MDLNFRPYSKAQQLHQKPKDKPKPKERRYKKKKKKLETYKGRTIPPARARGNISKKEYEKAVEAFGAVCAYCGDPYIEMHHIRFRSHQGRGNFRNLIPLCKNHHNQAHQNRQFADSLREQRIEMFGEWYWADKYDLFKAGLITNTTESAYEKFFLKGDTDEDELGGMAKTSDKR